MLRETGKVANTLLKVLPLLQNPADTRELLFYVTNGDRLATNHIKQTIGYALKPLSGLYNGYYCLNLCNESSQLCLRRLLEINESLRALQIPLSVIGGFGRIGDTSQKGNWSCFRNERLNCKLSFPINSKTVIPKMGILEFDFMSSSRPKGEGKKINSVSSSRLFGLLEKCKLMVASDRAEALRYLQKCKDDCNRILCGTGEKHSFYLLFICLFVCLFVRLFIRFLRSILRICTYFFIHSFIHYFARSFIYLSVHIFILALFI